MENCSVEYALRMISYLLFPTKVNDLHNLRVTRARVESLRAVRTCTQYGNDSLWVFVRCDALMPSLLAVVWGTTHRPSGNKLLTTFDIICDSEVLYVDLILSSVICCHGAVAKIIFTWRRWWWTGNGLLYGLSSAEASCLPWPIKHGRFFWFWISCQI